MTTGALNLARVDLVSLRLVVTCCDLGSISAAAGKCHLSVMGASERLRRLEDSLGKTLFHRHRRGLEPTAAGHVAVQWARLILAAVDSLALQLRDVEVSASASKANSGRRGSDSRSGGSAHDVS